MNQLPDVQRFSTAGGARVYRIACEVFDGMTGRVYLALGAGPATLVDCGSGQGESTRHLLDGLDAVRRDFGEPFEPAGIERILLTHGHCDHCGGLDDLLRLTGAEVGIHPADASAIRSPRGHEQEGMAAIGRFLDQAGVPAKTADSMLSVWSSVNQLPETGAAADLELEDDQRLDRLRILHVPGHSPGHVVVAVDDEILLCGDHILPRTVPQQTPQCVAPGGGLGRYLDSLDKVQRSGPFRLGLAGHEPVMENLSHRIDLLRKWQFRRNNELSNLVASERPGNVWEACRATYRDVEGLFLLFALFDTAARLEFLLERSQLAVDKRFAFLENY